MTSPNLREDLHFEVSFDGQTFTDVTPDLVDQSVAINYGAQDEMSAVQPAELSCQLFNLNGDYTPGKADSLHWPGVTLGIDARVRVGDPQPGLLLENAQDGVPNITQQHAITTDDPSLDITDLDARVDIVPHTWNVPHADVLAARWLNSDRGWMLTLNGFGDTSFLVLWWSTDGTSAGTQFLTSAVLPIAELRKTVRVTLVTDNGSGQHEFAVWLGDSKDGPFDQHGATQMVSGTTSIFNPSQGLSLGTTAGGSAAFGGTNGFRGMIHGFQLRNGVDGTVVADPTFEVVQSEFGDATGKTWTTQAGAIIVDPSIRLHGEVTAWEPTWPHGDLSDENDPGEARVDVRVAGILQRIGNDDTPLQDTITRFATLTDAPLLDYWPLSDEPGSTRASSAVGGSSLRAIGPPESAQFGRGDLAPWLPPSLLTGQTDGGFITGPARGPSGGWTVDFAYRAPDPAGWRDEQPQSSWVRVTDVEDIRYRIGIFTDFNELEIRVTNAADTTLGGTTAPADAVLDGQLHHIRFRVVEAVGLPQVADLFIDVDGTPAVASVAVDLGFFGFDATLAPATIDVGWFLQAPWVLPVNIGQLMMWAGTLASGVPPLSETSPAYRGYSGEFASVRVTRLCAEEGVPAYIAGPQPSNEPISNPPDVHSLVRLGPQYPGQLLELLQEAALADTGILHELRDAPWLVFRPGQTLRNQVVGLPLDASEEHGQVVNPFAPVLDDRGVVNDLTVERRGGESLRGTVDVGPKSTATPPAGAGRKRRQRTLSLASDLQVPDHLSWRLHVATAPGMRYPAVSPALDVDPDLIERWLRFRIGDRIQVTGLPPQHPADTVDVLGLGWAETIRPGGWDVEINAAPASPWTVGVRLATTDTPGPADPVRRDTAGSQLAATFIAGTDTSMDVETTQGPLWAVSGAGNLHLPLDVYVSGARVRVTAIGAAVGQVQTFTVEAAVVNGVEKTISAGEPVRLWQEAVRGL